MSGVNQIPVVSADEAWLMAMAYAYHGIGVEPRGLKTFEATTPITIGVNPAEPLVTNAARKLNYGFAVAEAYWIMTGDNRVETIGKYCNEIKRFSDDGLTFTGAYGPHFVDQLDYVIETLDRDISSRQAVIEIWSRKPAPSKDIPCTIALQFLVRWGSMQVNAFMRSSDTFLGLPYDIFNFIMLGHYVRTLFNERCDGELGAGPLFLTAGSSHLYERDIEGAVRCFSHWPAQSHQAERPVVASWLEYACGPKFHSHGVIGELATVRNEPSLLFHRGKMP